jgi:hypothetical protein
MKILFWLISILFSNTLFAQSNQDTMLMRRDTVLLRADKTIVETILKSVAQGKLKAIDYTTNQRIPPGQVYTWRMATDTVLRYDTSGNSKLEIVQQYRKAEHIPQIRMQQDWYFDSASGRIISRVRWIELLEEISSSTGEFVGLRPFCRVYY